MRADHSSSTRLEHSPASHAEHGIAGSRTSRSAATVTRQRGERRAFAEPLATIAEALERMRYGAIQLTVHDGKVMQVDVTERRRFGD